MFTMYNANDLFISKIVLPYYDLDVPSVSEMEGPNYTKFWEDPHFSSKFKLRSKS